LQVVLIPPGDRQTAATKTTQQHHSDLPNQSFVLHDDGNIDVMNFMNTIEQKWRIQLSTNERCSFATTTANKKSKEIRFFLFGAKHGCE
jgi:GH25 family lysozyme M1 (1,4-beta-N-acetylmuramidase)